MTNTPQPFARRPALQPWTVVAVALVTLPFLLLEYGATSRPGVGARLHAASATPDSPAAVGEGLSLAEHLDRLGVTVWHKAGHRGQGVKVLVLDTGFNGYRDHLGHALPEHVTVKSFRTDGKFEAKASQHGILCAEVVHTLAPDAEILLANWEPDRPDQFLDALRWAKDQGVGCVTCSVITPSWSDGEGGGSVHAAMARILGDGSHAGDMLFFASAGNTAERHWGGPFRDGGDGYHAWAAGNRDNAIQPWGADVVSAELCCAKDCKLELSVYDTTSRETVGTTAAATVHDHGCAVVRFLPRADHAYVARVRTRDASPGPFHLVVLGGGLQVATARGSVPFPADGAEVIAVGAVDADGRRTAYSSCGPNASGAKPNLVATVPFPSAWRGRPFSGTSAAAPQGAALAALQWSKNADWKAVQVRDSLRRDAVQLSKTSPDPETGCGRLHLPGGERATPRP